MTAMAAPKDAIAKSIRAVSTTIYAYILCNQSYVLSFNNQGIENAYLTFGILAHTKPVFALFAVTGAPPNKPAVSNA
jgi:hypothetical protein